MDGMLSQEEINALLSGMDVSDGSEADSDTPEGTGSSEFEELTDMEKDTLGEVANISMGTASTTLSSLLNQKINISTPVVSYAKWEDLVSSYDRPCVLLEISYKEGLHGKNILVLKENDVKIITDLMMGGDGTNIDGEINELQLSAIGEAMNQMMGSAATSISSMLDMKVDILPPVANLMNLNDEVKTDELKDFMDGIFVKISFSMVMGDLINSQIMQLFPIDFAKILCDKFTQQTIGSNEESMPKEAPVDSVASSVAPNVQPSQAQPNMEQQMPQQQMPQQQMPMGQMGYPQQQMPMGQMGYPQQQMPMGQMGYPGQMPMQDVNIQPAQFQPFESNVQQFEHRENINLLMDVPLEVTAELGRTQKSINEILDFTPGTIIELDKMAGEPIDVLVNGKFVAKGEVVVIEESFGIRITEIIQE